MLQLMAIVTDLVKRGIRLIHLPSFAVYKNWPINAVDTFSLVKDISFSPSRYLFPLSSFSAILFIVFFFFCSGLLMTGENTGRVKMFRLLHYPAA